MIADPDDEHSGLESRSRVALPAPALSEATATAPYQYVDVLLAEDDDALRRVLSDFLAAEGFLVREATDLATVRRELSRTSPHAIVADFNLEGGDVSEIVAELARRADRPHLVLMSASAGAAQLAREHDIQLLTKPFDLEALVQALLVPLDERPSVFP